jgi:Zn-finger protein
MYTVDYFIKKFEAIPEDQWGTGKYVSENNRMCALGFCGVRPCENTEEGDDLSVLSNNMIHFINDGKDYHYTESTPKQRVLAYLYNVKKHQEAAEQKIVEENIKQYEKFADEVLSSIEMPIFESPAVLIPEIY